MRVASIDLGTNTFNLLIADLLPHNKKKTVFKIRVSVRLGEKISEGIISEEAYQRGMRALEDFHFHMTSHKVDRAEAFATSAIRSSSNGAQFCEEAKAKTGIDIHVIDGNKEAELIYHGVRRAVTLSKPALILDIGGGSNEFIIASRSGIHWKQSFNLGIARLIQRFKPSDPITANEQKEMEDYLTEELRDLFDALKVHPVSNLVGASGSFETFAELALRNFRDGSSWTTNTEFRFLAGEFSKVYQMLIGSTREERLAMRGMHEIRADMIIPALILVNLVLRNAGIKKLRVSDYSLQEGVLFEILKR